MEKDFIKRINEITPEEIIEDIGKINLDEIEERINSHLKNGFFNRKDMKEMLISNIDQLIKFSSEILNAIKDESMVIKHMFYGTDIPIKDYFKFVKRQTDLVEMHLRNTHKWIKEK